MKIAITTQGRDIDAPFEERFGRAPGYIICEAGGANASYLDNSRMQSMSHGAGIQAAQAVAGSGVGIVITGHCGPKAFQVLRQAKIRVYNARTATAREALAAYEAGQLQEQTSA